VGFPRWLRRQRREAHWREGSGEEAGQCSGPEASTRGEEAIGAVELNGEGAEGGVRRRQELTGDKGNDGDRAPVMDWRRGGVVELRHGAV
jgi:hypothetical protein